jgi:hypothetical protein
LSASPVLRRVARRFGWGLADQAMSSVSNAAVSFYVARELGASQFGAFSLAYVTYSFALNASRGLATYPLVVRYSNGHPAEWRRAVAKSTGTAVTVGLVAGACAMAAAMVLHGTPGWPSSRSAWSPGLMLQTAGGTRSSPKPAAARPSSATRCGSLSLLPALGSCASPTAPCCSSSAWGLAAAVAACVGPLQADRAQTPVDAGVGDPRPGAAIHGENAANSASGQLRSYGVGIIVSLAAVGYIQAGLLGRSWCAHGDIADHRPEAARVLRRSPRLWSRTAWRSGPGWRSWRAWGYSC